LLAKGIPRCVTIEGLVESMHRLADFMDKTLLVEQGKRIRALGEEIQKEKYDGGIETVKPLVAEMLGYFWGWGGGLFDIVFLKNEHIPEGMTVESANTTYDALLDDLFFNLLFWDTEKEEALRTYEEMTNLYRKSLDEKHEKFLKEHPEAAELSRDGAEKYMPMGFYFHWNPEWFKEWTDLAKLPIDEMRRDD
jgi:hypothetical protein